MYAIHNDFTVIDVHHIVISLLSVNSTHKTKQAWTCPIECVHQGGLRPGAYFNTGILLIHSSSGFPPIQ